MHKARSFTRVIAMAARSPFVRQMTLILVVRLWSGGPAVAFRKYSDKYVANEEHARAAKRGLWGGTFEMPWEYRERKRKESAAAPPPSCPPEPDPLKAQCVIKGNVSGNGRIYHMPGSPDYEKVVIIWGSTFATRVTGKHRAERQ
jgi:hypothetical protein